MANAILSYENIADSATLSSPAGTTTETDLGVDNLQSRQLSKKTRFTSDDNEQVKVDFGSQETFDTIVVIAHNMTTSATWQVETSNDDFSSVDHDSGSLSVWFGSQTDVDQAILLYRPSSALTNQYVRLTFDDSSNPDAYIELGRLIIDEAYQPDINVEYGFSIRYIDPSARRFSRNGTPWFDTKTKRRRFQFRIIQVGDTSEADAFNNDFELERQLGRTGDVFFSLDPDEQSTRLYYWSVYGVLRETQPLRFVQFQKFGKPYEIEEVR